MFELNEPNLNPDNPLLVGLEGQSEKLPFPNIFSSSEETSIENLQTIAEEDLLLVPQDASRVGLSNQTLLDDDLIGTEVVGEFDELTGINESRIEIQPRAGRDPGNNRRKAQSVGSLISNQSIVRQDFVGKGDKKDFYKFEVSQQSLVNITLDDLEDNAKLQLLNRKGKNIKTSNKRGTADEEILEVLKPGTYYVKVQAKRKNSTNYSLTLENAGIATDLDRATLDFQQAVASFNKKPNHELLTKAINKFTSRLSRIEGVDTNSSNSVSVNQNSNGTSALSTASRGGIPLNTTNQNSNGTSTSTMFAALWN